MGPNSIQGSFIGNAGAFGEDVYLGPLAAVRQQMISQLGPNDMFNNSTPGFGNAMYDGSPYPTTYQPNMEEPGVVIPSEPKDEVPVPIVNTQAGAAGGMMGNAAMIGIGNNPMRYGFNNKFVS